MDSLEPGQRSIVLTIFFVVFSIGLVATAGGSAYLYFNWEKHFPPIADLQEQVRIARNISKEDAAAQEEAEDQLESSGLNNWFDELEDQASRQQEEIVKQASEEALRAQGGAGMPPGTPTAPDPGTGGFVPSPPPLASETTVRPPAQPSSAPALPTAAPERPARKERSGEVQVLKEGGTIEPMDDDWLPPGVSRAK